MSKKRRYKVVNEPVEVRRRTVRRYEEVNEPSVTVNRRTTIRRTLGEPVLAIVEACSDATPDESGEKAPWAQRKLAYLDHLAQAPRDALLVSCCDKLHNARAIADDLQVIGAALWDRFNAPPPQIVWYYESLSKRFADLGVEGSAALAAAVERMRRVSGIEPVAASALDAAAAPTPPTP